jgi:OmpA-OmpF porin, OOP family
VISSKIQFEKNTARLKPSSYKPLDELIPVLKKYNTIILIIEAYPGDKTGGDSKELSLRRSEAVKHYLIKKGIYEGRLNPVVKEEEVKGSGPKNVELKTVY